jgi:hypothetical protein
MKLFLDFNQFSIKMKIVSNFCGLPYNKIEEYFKDNIKLIFITKPDEVWFELN